MLIYRNGGDGGEWKLPQKFELQWQPRFGRSSEDLINCGPHRKLSADKFMEDRADAQALTRVACNGKPLFGGSHVEATDAS